MAEFGKKDLSGSTFDWTDLSGSTFRAAPLSNVTIRGTDPQRKLSAADQCAARWARTVLIGVRNASPQTVQM